MTDDTMRRQIGRLLLRWALQILPEWCYERKVLVADTADFRQYERYRSLTLLMDRQPMRFSEWRREWYGMIRMCKPHLVPQRSGTTARERAVMGEAVAR